VSETEKVLGIDLGTTYSAMALADEFGQVEMVLNREESNTTPSVVLVENGEFRVGREAAAQAIAKPDDVVQCIKRKMGDAKYRFQKKYSPEEISAKILEKLVRDAEAHLKHPVKRVVITVPAYFTEPQLRATKEAGQLAGLTVEALLPEPEAAAIHFGIKRLGADESVLVCDLGGGTYDASILKMEDGKLKAVNTRGSRKLGGHDWTMRMTELMGEQIAEETGVDPRKNLTSWQILFDRCEELKRVLSTLESTELEWNHEGTPLQFPVTRDEFNERTQHHLDEVLNKTGEAVRTAGLKFDDITHVLLVGGSSRLPAFIDGIARITGKKPRKTQNPDEAVARGAALIAHSYATGQVDRKRGRITIKSGGGTSGKITIIERSVTHALGTMTFQRNATGIDYVYETIIAANSQIPCGESKSGFGVEPGQATFQVPVVQLDSEGKKEDILCNYQFTVDPVPTTQIRVRCRFDYDENGLVEVTAFHTQTDQKIPGERQPFEPPDLTAKPPRAAKPGTAVLCIDCSSSMMGSKIIEAKKLLPALAEKYAKERGWQVSLVNFGGPYDISPSRVLLEPTQSLEDIRAAADRLRAAGGTPMDAGLHNIRTVLESAPPDAPRLGILLTDGEPNNRVATEQAAQTLKALKITIATVPIGTNADHNFLKKIGDLESEITVDSQGGGMVDAVINLLKKMEEGPDDG